jgi:hypothetical protein
MSVANNGPQKKCSLERDFKGGNLKSLEMRFILEEGFLGM